MCKGLAFYHLSVNFIAPSQYASLGDFPDCVRHSSEL